MPSTNPLLKGGYLEGHHGQALGEKDPHHGRRHEVVNQVPQPQLRNLTIRGGNRHKLEYAVRTRSAVDCAADCHLY